MSTFPNPYETLEINKLSQSCGIGLYISYILTSQSTSGPAEHTVTPLNDNFNFQLKFGVHITSKYFQNKPI